jgi:hypothetical protein
MPYLSSKAETNASEDARCGFCLTDTKHVCLPRPRSINSAGPGPAGTDMLVFMEGVEKMIKGKYQRIYALTHSRLTASTHARMDALTHIRGKRD